MSDQPFLNVLYQILDEIELMVRGALEADPNSKVSNASAHNQRIKDFLEERARLVRELSNGTAIAKRAMVMQQKTQHPVQFEIMKHTRHAISDLIAKDKLSSNDYLFQSRFKNSPHISTRQYARIVKSWVCEIGLNPSDYGPHSLRRTKETLIYKRTKNLRAVQLLLGHTKLESTVRYLGIEVDDALEIAVQTEV